MGSVIMGNGLLLIPVAGRDLKLGVSTNFHETTLEGASLFVE